MLTIKEDGNTWQANLVISKALCEDELESIYVCKRGIVPRDCGSVGNRSRYLLHLFRASGQSRDRDATQA